MDKLHGIVVSALPYNIYKVILTSILTAVNGKALALIYDKKTVRLCCDLIVRILGSRYYLISLSFKQAVGKPDFYRLSFFDCDIGRDPLAVDLYILFLQGFIKISCLKSLEDRSSRLYDMLIIQISCNFKRSHRLLLNTEQCGKTQVA